MMPGLTLYTGSKGEMAKGMLKKGSRGVEAGPRQPPGLFATVRASSV